MDDAAGEYAGTEIVGDLDVARLDRIPASALHREVDLAVIEADLAGI